MARQVFYSFHYKPDVTRVAKIRNIGVIEGNRPAPDNAWEKVVGGGEAAIKKWIAGQMKGRSCTVVLVGLNTANRHWINHEIFQSWNERMGVVGIRIHGILDLAGETTAMGNNPFDHITFNKTGKRTVKVHTSLPESHDHVRHLFKNSKVSRRDAVIG